jgi:hypothetical protein
MFDPSTTSAELPPSQVLLVPDVLIGSDIEPGVFGAPQERAIFKLRMPSHLDERAHLVVA